MKYTRFEDLPVWKAALDFSLNVFELVKDRTFASGGDLGDQLQRASLSISLNVAEGFERSSTSELLYFLYIARGSAGESRSALRFCELYPDMAHLRPQVTNLIASAENISRQLRAWADSLQNSDITGQRHLNEATRTEYEQRRRSEQFLSKLEEIRRRAQQPPAPNDESDQTPI